MRYIDADLIEYEPMCRARGNGMYEDCEIAHKDQIDNIPTADVVEIGKPYFYEEGYVLKDFHNDGDRCFVIERDEE